MMTNMNSGGNEQLIGPDVVEKGGNHDTDVEDLVRCQLHMELSEKTDNIVEVSGEVLLGDARSVEVGSDNVCCSHSDDISEHGGEDGVVEAVQDEEVNQRDHGVAGDAGEADRTDRAVLGLSANEAKASTAPESRCRQNTHGEHIDGNDDDHVDPQVRRVAEKGIVDYRDVGAANENANTRIVQRLEDVFHLLTHAEEVVEDGAPAETADGTQNKHGDWPARNVRTAIHVVVNFFMDNSSKRNINMGGRL